MFSFSFLNFTRFIIEKTKTKKSFLFGKRFKTLNLTKQGTRFCIIRVRPKSKTKSKMKRTKARRLSKPPSNHTKSPSTKETEARRDPCSKSLLTTVQDYGRTVSENPSMPWLAGLRELMRRRRPPPLPPPPSDILFQF